MYSITPSELNLVNSKLGMKILLRNKKVDLIKTIERIHYENELKHLQSKLILLQQWVIKNDKKVVLIFEGRDAAGKGGAIRRAIQYLNPRHINVVALDIPSEDEKKTMVFSTVYSSITQTGRNCFL